MNKYIASLFSILILMMPISAGTFSISPAAGVLNIGCSYSVDILINTSSKQSNAAEVELKYNSQQIEIIDSDIYTNGIQIKTGNAYQAYVQNTVNPSTGIIKIVATSFDTALINEKVFATVQFRTKQYTLEKVRFEIAFSGIGKTLDSNIAEKSTGLDILESVSNAEFSLANSTQCVTDSNNTIKLNEEVDGSLIVAISNIIDKELLLKSIVIINDKALLLSDLSHTITYSENATRIVISESFSEEINRFEFIVNYNSEILYGILNLNISPKPTDSVITSPTYPLTPNPTQTSQVVIQNNGYYNLIFIILILLILLLLTYIILSKSKKKSGEENISPIED